MNCFVLVVHFKRDPLTGNPCSSLLSHSKDPSSEKSSIHAFMGNCRWRRRKARVCKSECKSCFHIRDLWRSPMFRQLLMNSALACSSSMSREKIGYLSERCIHFTLPKTNSYYALVGWVHFLCRIDCIRVEKVRGERVCFYRTAVQKRTIITRIIACVLIVLMSFGWMQCFT